MSLSKVQESQQTMMDNLEDIYSLSLNQKGVLLHNLSSPESSDIYMTQMVAELSGDVNVNIFKEAWQLVINRHPMLRTAFMWEDLDDPLQVVFRKATLPVTDQDWTNFSAEDQNLILEKFLLKDRQKGFLLSDAPLCRLAIFKKGEGKYLFIFTFHILLLDGWSKGVVFNEVLDFYNQLSTGQQVKLQPAQSFKRYIKWSVEEDFTTAEKYWRSKLKGYKSPIHIGTNGFSSTPVNLNFQEDSVEVEATIIKDLETFARKNRLTLNTIVQGTWALLLSHYSGQNDVVFGAAVSGRPPELPGTESIVGFMINTIPVRIKTSGHDSVLKWFKELQEEQNELRNYENVPLPEIRKWTDLDRSEKLFESVLLFENWPNVEVLSHFKNMKFCPLVRTMYPLTLCILPKDSTYTLYIAYEVERFDASTINQILNDYKSLFQSIVKTPEFSVDKLLLPLSGKGIFKSAGEKKREHKNRPAVKPSTETEKTIAGICSDLLGIEEVSVDQNFFELGGHSLFAANLITHLNKIFHIELPLSKFFETPTIKGLSEFIDKQENNLSDNSTGLSNIPKIIPDFDNYDEPFQLRAIQQAYWIGRTQAFDMGNVTANVYLELDCHSLDIDKFVKAWKHVINRHGMLRLIVTEEGQQQILKNIPAYEIKPMDLSSQETGHVNLKISNIRNEMFYNAHDPSQWPLFEFRATKLGDEHYRLHFCFDLLNIDAGSVSIIFNELYLIYSGQNHKLPELKLSFRDYVLAEESFKNSDLYNRSKDYWFGRLSEIPPAPDLPLAINPSNLNNPKFIRRNYLLEANHWKNIKASAAKYGITASGVLLAAFSQILAIWSRSPKFTINIPMFNRLPFHDDVNRIVGDFTSINLLTVDYSEINPFKKRAKDVQTQLWKDLDHQYINGVEVIRELGRLRNSNLTAIMPIVFTSLVELDYTGNMNKFGELVHNLAQTPQVWLDHQVREDNGNLIYHWDSVEGLFPDGLMEAMARAYADLLTELATSVDSWEKLDWQLIPDEQVKRHNQLNETTSEYPKDLIQSIFEKQVSVNPQQLAVVSNKKTFTYEQLYRKTNKLARYLRANGAITNSPVAVITEKGWEQVFAVYGILNSGAAYLPIDPDYPNERIKYLLEHGNVKLALTQSWIKSRLSVPEDVQLISVDEINLDEFDDSHLEPVNKQDDLAYVLYTSGSTGQPKGVMIEHRNVVNRMLDVNERFNINSKDRVIALTALQHDLSVYDLFGTIFAGATLIIPDASARRDPAHWADLMTEHKVTFWNSVPAFMEMLVDYLEQNQEDQIVIPRTLSKVFLSGDYIPVNLPDRLRNLIKDVQVVSLGGPTETTVWDICYPIDKVNPDWRSIPYGKPMKNAKYFILNSLLLDCPDWVVGEIYISGAGLARGFWRDDQKTTEKFIPHPKTRERIYRSGDLGRYLPDGNIEIMGRADFQVKVRGFRIELEEIESAIRKHPDVSETVVVAFGESHTDKKLVAYIVSKEKNQITTVDQPEKIISDSGKIENQSSNENLNSDNNPKAESTSKKSFLTKWLGRFNDFRQHYKYAKPGIAQARYYLDPVASMEFKLKQLGIRQNIDNSTPVQLPTLNKDENQIRKTYLKRQSYRNFINESISLEKLSAVLNSISQLQVDELPFPKYRYPSAGSCYPVQAYLWIKPEKIIGLEGGCYYYNPKEHQLVLIKSGVMLNKGDFTSNNHRIFEESAFFIILVGQLKAIEPLYGKIGKDFCTLEAGYMGQLLMTEAPNFNIGLCPMGSVVYENMREHFLLEESHICIHGLLGGAIDPKIKESFGFIDESGNSSAVPSGAGGEIKESLEIEIQKYLSNLLPDYMVPNNYVLLDKLPLTPNGKIDRSALPAPDDKPIQVREKFDQSKLTPAMRKILSIVENILRVDNLNPDSNLINIGANSIHIVRIGNQLEKEFGKRPRIDQIFRMQTIGAIAEFYGDEILVVNNDLNEQISESNETDKALKLLEKIDQLTEDEVKKLLEANKKK